MLVRIFIAFTALFLLISCPQVKALENADTVLREDNNALATQLQVPVYMWHIPSKAPQAVLVMIHGVTLHGGVFDTLAHRLAEDGYLVVSPDLRGFGRWCLGSNKYAPGGQVSYYKSRADLIRLLANLKTQYPKAPIYCIGESLGANLAFWLASVCPDYVNGIIASSPCVKRKLVFCPNLVPDTVRSLAHCNQQVAVGPYAKRYLSEDPRIIDAYLKDPLMRKTMSAYESFQSLHTARSTLWFVDQIPANIPVLVIEGTRDRMFDPRQTMAFLHKIKVSDRRLHWLQGKGHIQLETPYVSDDVFQTVSTWLAEHSAQMTNCYLSKDADGYI